MTRPYQICKRCIMDTADPDIVFDENGYCNHCKGYYERIAQEGFSKTEKKEKLEQLISIIKREGKGKEYDCIIGVSGGVDSTTVAFSVKQLGLRPLAVHFDNGWDSELAVDNIKKTLSNLKIDLYTHVVDWEEFRDLQLAFLRASISNAEIPTDHGIFALLFQVAVREQVRFILTGSNLVTEGMYLPFTWGYYYQDLRLLKAIHRKFGTIPLKTFPQIDLTDYLYYVLVKKIRQIPFLNYVDYNKPDAIKLIQKEICWRPYGGKHYESIYTRFYQGYILLKKFGYDKRRVHLSTLICSGQITRQEALLEIENDPYAGHNAKEDKEFVIKKLGISADEFEQIMQLPVKTYKDYPSYAVFLVGMPRIRAFFKKIAVRA
jgi:N-acetyl sugar amidotransferase